MVDITFGPQILAKRLALQWTQSDLGRRAGINPTQIGHYEANGRAPSASNLVALARALGVSVEYLAGENGTDYDLGYRRGYFTCREDMKIATRERLTSPARP